MKVTSVVISALAVLAVAASDPALARAKKAKHTACTDRPTTFSWNFLLPGPAPQPNGCSPPVFSNGQFVGQDPDPFIRQQLLRDPATGYGMNF